VISTSTGKELFTEELVYRPFHSFTVAFVGETQQAGDAKNSPAVNTWVIQKLLNGYDVHVWDDGHDWFQSDNCDEWGAEPALNEVANAINNQGIASIAILGYSHGGGSTYNLAWRMYYDGKKSNSVFYQNLPRLIFKNYTLTFTSYIDAVPNASSVNGGLGDSLEKPPLGSRFHTNQYETNSWLVQCCSVPGSDDDIDRSSLGVEHSGGGELGIDTNSIVQEFLTTRFHQKVKK
jgi:hypothetical protein